ncbi:MAG: SWIM zinc finger family protein [Pseudomonadales bacterium]|nr:SWIM zinc finger family protein [Pseudomonadales bacterium]
MNVEKGVIEAIVNGSTLYNIKIEIKPLAKSQWKKLQEKCAGEIGSLLELLQGRISSSVMSTVTDTSEGLFPLAKEIDFDCDCPDSAYMCKHIAAVLYGIGARLDHAPELLFLLREVNHEDLISSEVSLVTDKTNRKKLKGDLSDIFDIELDAGLKKPTKKVTKKATTPKSSPLKSTAKAKKKPSKTNLKKKQQTITATSIRRLKKKLGLNNTEFARLLEVSSATVARWEKQTGQLNLRDHNRERILFVLEMDINSALEIIDPL